MHSQESSKSGSNEKKKKNNGETPQSFSSSQPATPQSISSGVTVSGKSKHKSKTKDRDQERIQNGSSSKIVKDELGTKSKAATSKDTIDGVRKEDQQVLRPSPKSTSGLECKKRKRALNSSNNSDNCSSNADNSGSSDNSDISDCESSGRQSSLSRIGSVVSGRSSSLSSVSSTFDADHRKSLKDAKRKRTKEPMTSIKTNKTSTNNAAKEQSSETKRKDKSNNRLEPDGKKSSKDKSKSKNSDNSCESKGSKDKTKDKDSDRKQRKAERKQAKSSKDIGNGVAKGVDGGSGKSKEKSVKKEATTSTTISFSNNNSTGTTTLEIKSVKNVKMSEVKKENASPTPTNGSTVGPTSTPNTNEEKPSESKSNKFAKSSANKQRLSEESPISSPAPSLLCFSKGSDANDRSVPTSNGVRSTTGGAVKIVDNYERIMADMRKNRELSPLSSDAGSEINFGSMKRKEDSFNLSEEDEDEENEEDNGVRKRLTNGKIDSFDYETMRRKMAVDDSDVEVGERLSLFDGNKYKKKLKKDSSSLLSGSTPIDNTTVTNTNNTTPASTVLADLTYVNELILLQKQLSELQDADLLQQIVNIIEVSGIFELTSTTVDFDLMQLDRSTVKRIKLCLP